MTLAALLTAALGACTAPKSGLMAPVTTGRSGAVADEATILFIADVRDAIGSSHLWTIHDEKMQFMGELTGVSAFEARVPPGRHAFGASAMHSGLFGSLCFSGEYAAGKYYVAWLRMSNDSGMWQTKWIFPRPGSKTMDARSIVDSAPLFEPDIQSGQRFLDAKHPKKCEATASEQNPASFGFDTAP